MHRLQSDLLFSNAFQHAGIGMAIVGLDGKWLKVNQSICKITGFEEKELLNITFQDITHPEDLNMDLAHVQELIFGHADSYQMEKRYINKNGDIINIFLTASIVRDERNEPLYFISQIQDITEYKKSLTKLKLFAQAAETTQHGVTITSSNGAIIYINNGFTKITGYSIDEVKGRNPRLLQSGKHNKDFYKNMWDTLQATGHWEGEIWNKNKAGEVYPEWLNISEVKDEAGDTIHYVAVFSDITEVKKVELKLKEINEKLSRLSSLDGLTGIPNRRTFDETLEREWYRALNNQTSISLIMLDIDFFKKYNDTYGHLQGDDCLKKVAQTLADSGVRPTDLVARYGGEEFGIILPDRSEEEAYHIAQLVNKKIESLNIPHINSEVAEHVTVSAGVATITPTEERHSDNLIEAADQALYEAKRNGRNLVAVNKQQLIRQ